MENKKKAILGIVLVAIIVGGVFGYLYVTKPGIIFEEEEDLSDLEVKIHKEAWSSYVVDLTSRDAQFYVIGWAPDYADADNYAYPYGHPTGTFAYWSNINDSTLKNWITGAEMTTDPAMREAYYKNITRRMHDKAYYLWLNQDMNFHVQRARVEGYYFNPMHYMYAAPWLPRMSLTEGSSNFTYEGIGEPNYMDPAINYETTGGGIMQQVIEPLVWYYGENTETLEPWLAKNWTVSNDGTTYNFTLREGLEFSNGDPLNATSAVYSLYRWPLSYPTYSGPQWMALEHIKGAEGFKNAVDAGEDPNVIADEAENLLDAQPFKVLGEYKLQVNLAHAFAPFIKILANSWGSVLNPWYLHEQAGEDFLKFNATGDIEVNRTHVGNGYHVEALEDGSALSGTGPYTFEEWKKEQYLTLNSRGNDYWGGPYNDTPTIDTFYLNLVPEWSTRKTDFDAGTADVIDVPSIHAYEFIKEDPWQTNQNIEIKDDYIEGGEELIDVPQPGLTFVVASGHYNVNETVVDPQGNRFTNPFRLQKMRRATSYLFPYKQWFRDALNNFAVRLNGSCIPKGMFGWAGDDSDVQDAIQWQNIQEGKKLLKEVHQNHPFTSENLTFHFYYNEGNTAREYVCTMLKSVLENAADEAAAEIEASSHEPRKNEILLEWMTFVLTVNGDGRKFAPKFLPWN